MKKNAVGQHVAFQLNGIVDGQPVKGIIPTVEVSKDGAAAVTGGGSVTEPGNFGQYVYLCTQDETNAEHVAFTINFTTALSQTVNVYPIDVSEYMADVAGIIKSGEAADYVSASGSQTVTATRV